MLAATHQNQRFTSPKLRYRPNCRSIYVLAVTGLVLSTLVASADAAGASPVRTSGVSSTASTAATLAASPSGPIPNLDKGFDTSDQVSDFAVSCLKAKGYHFGILYVNGVQPGWKDTYRYLQNHGMTAVLNQGFEDKHLYDTASNAADRGKSNVAAAQSVSYPKGSDIFLDVEQTGSASRAQLITWINAWSKKSQQPAMSRVYIPGFRQRWHPMART